jgi:hypothetical protein
MTRIQKLVGASLAAALIAVAALAKPAKECRLDGITELLLRN